MSTVQPFILDGDTVYDRNEGSRRLHGINAPEISHKPEEVGQAGGEEASARLGALLAENPDAIWESITGDVYGRDVGRFVTKDGRDLNEQLVREGYAPAMSFGGQASPYLQAEADYVRDLHAGKADYAIEGGGFLPKDPVPLDLTQELGEAVRRGYDQTQGLLGFGASALARSVGADEISDYFQDIAVSNFQEASQHAATIGSYKDVDFDKGILNGLRDSARYGIGIIGEQIPQIAFDAVAALTTGGLGAIGTTAVKAGIKEGIAGVVAKSVAKSTANKGLLASMTIQQIGEVESELINEGVDAPLTAIVGGLTAGAVDFIGAKALMRTAGDLYKQGSNVKASSLLQQGLSNSAFEGATEGLQTIIAKAAVLHEKTGYDLMSDANIEEFFNAVIAGSVVGSAPAFISGGAKTIKGTIDKISERNAKIMDASGTQTPTSMSVTTEYTDENGEVVRVAQEAATLDELETVKAAHQAKAAKAGITDTTTRFEDPTEIQKERQEDGTSVVTDNGDRTTENVRNLSAEFRGLAQGVRDTIILSDAEFEAYRQNDDSYKAIPDVKVTRTDDGQVVVSRGEEAHKRVADASTEFNPQEFTDAQYEAYLDSIQEQVAPEGGKTSAPEKEKESEEEVTEAEPEVKPKRKTKTGKDRAFGNKQSRADLVDEQYQQYADESPVDDPNFVPDSVVEANKKAEEERVSKFDLDEKGVPIAPGKKVEKAEEEKEDTEAKKARVNRKGAEAKDAKQVADKVVPFNELSTEEQAESLIAKAKGVKLKRGQEKLDAVADEKDAQDKLLQSGRRNIKASDVDGFSKQERRESVRSKVSAIAGIDASNDARVDAVTEELIAEFDSEEGQPVVADSTLTPEEIKFAEAVQDVKKAQEENKKAQDEDSVGDSDDITDNASEQELFNGLSEKVLDNKEKEVYDGAVAAGLDAVRSMVIKQALRNNEIDRWQELGFPTRIAMVNARNANNELIGKAKRGEIKDVIFTGSKDEDLHDVVSKFGHVDPETGEVEIMTLYMPDVMKYLYENSDTRFETSASTSFASRMMNLYGEFLGSITDLGLVPLDFDGDPSKLNTKAHIAYQPSYTAGNKPYTLDTLQEDVKNTYKDRGSDSGDFLQVGQEQARTDALIEIDNATDLYVKALKTSLIGDAKTNSVQSAQFENLQALHDNFDNLIEAQARERKEFEANRQSEGEVSGEAQAVEPERFSEASAPSTGTSKSKLGKEAPKPKKKKTFRENVRENVRDLLDSIGAVSSVGVRFDNTQKQVAQVVLEDDHVSVVINEKMLKEIRDENPEAAAYILAHEVGHVFTAEAMQNIPSDVLAGLHKSFRKARAKKPAGHPYRRGKGVGFDEWLADQFAVHMTKPLGEMPNTFWKKLVAGLRKIANSIAPLFGKERVSFSYSGQAFMESMFKSGIKNKTMSNPEFMDSLASMNLEFGGNYPRSRAQERRFFVENKALGKKTDGLQDSKHGRDFTLGQNLNKTSDLGRTAINAFGQVAKSVVTDPSYIPTQASKLVNSVRKAAPVIFTSINEMKHIQGGRQIAKMYRKLFDDTVAESALWQNEAAHVMEGVSDSEIENFIKGETGVPKKVQKFMDKFHKQLKRTMPTLGYVSGYFPRAYDVQAIEQNRSALEALLFLEAQKAGLSKFDELAAKNAVDSILQDPASTTGVDSDSANVFGNDPFSQKTRVLDFISDDVLRQNGFLRKDVGDVLLSYVHRMTRRANFEKQFSGYAEITNESATQKEMKSAAKFTSDLFRTLPFRFNDGKGALMSYEDKAQLFGAPDIDFFNRNREYFKVAEKNGWVKETTDKEGHKHWSYYDKNHVLRQAYDAVKDPNDKHRFLKIVDALEGRIGAAELSPKVRDAMSTAIAYQNWTTLLFSGFSQLAEVSGLIFRNRDLEGAFDSLKEIGKLVAGQDRHERRKLMNDLGFAQKQLTQQAILEGMGVNYQSAFAQKANNLLFKVNGMNYITNASRVAGAAVAERFIIRHARKAADGNSRSTRYLKELGLTPEQAMKMDSPSYKYYDSYVREGDLTSAEAKDAEAIHKAMFKFVDSAVIRPNATQRPVWGSDPRWMLVWHLKSFMYAYGSVILGGLNSEVQARYKETGGKKLDAAMPLLVYAIPLLMVSGLALELREFAQYSVFGLGSRPYSDGLHGADYIMELASRGGALGPMEMGYSFVEDEQKGRSALMGLLGPTAQQLETILEFDAAKTINRSVPILSQNPAFKEWSRELLR